MFIYPIYNHNWRNISTIYTHITRLASKEIFSPSNKIYREVGRAKDLPAPLYLWTLHNIPFNYILNTVCTLNALEFTDGGSTQTFTIAKFTDNFTITPVPNCSFAIDTKLIANRSFARGFNAVFFFMSDFPASEYYVPTFRNTLSVPSS